MKTIEYSTGGKCYPDAYVEAVAREFLVLPGDRFISVANDTFITACRCLIHEGVIPHTEVRFLYDGQCLAPNADGKLSDWPMGFCDTMDLMLVRLLGSEILAGKEVMTGLEDTLAAIETARSACVVASVRANEIRTKQLDKKPALRLVR